MQTAAWDIESDTETEIDRVGISWQEMQLCEQY